MAVPVLASSVNSRESLGADAFPKFVRYLPRAGILTPRSMGWDDLELHEPEEDPRPGPDDDPSVQELEPLLLELFAKSPDAVFYESQPCVHFVDRFFHWVMARALKDLRDGNKIASEMQALTPKTRSNQSPRRRYRHRPHREDVAELKLAGCAKTGCAKFVRLGDAPPRTKSKARFAGGSLSSLPAFDVSLALGNRHLSC